MTLGFNSTVPSNFDPQYPFSHAALQHSRRSSSPRRRKTPNLAQPLPAFSIDYQPLFQHHVYFHILTNCGRAMCLTFTSLQKKTGVWGVNVLSNSSERQGPPTWSSVMIGNRLQPAYPLRAYIFPGLIRLCKRPACKRPGLATIGLCPPNANDCAWWRLEETLRREP